MTVTLTITAANGAKKVLTLNDPVVSTPPPPTGYLLNASGGRLTDNIGNLLKAA